MPIKAQSNRSTSESRAFVIDIAGKRQDVVERMIDRITGEIFLDFSQSSFILDDIDMSNDNEENENSSVNSDVPSKRVSFADEEVSHVWERAYTTSEEKKILFYSGREIAEFRQQYRAIIRARRDALMQGQSILQSSTSQSSTFSEKSSLTLSGLNTMIRAASQIALAVSQSGRSLVPLMNQQDSSEAMLVVDTLYLF